MITITSPKRTIRARTTENDWVDNTKKKAQGELCGFFAPDNPAGPLKLSDLPIKAHLASLGMQDEKVAPLYICESKTPSHGRKQAPFWGLSWKGKPLKQNVKKRHHCRSGYGLETPYQLCP